MRTGVAVAAMAMVLGVTAGPGGAAAAPLVRDGGAGAGSAAAGVTSVTLITGDRVTLDAKGKVSAVVRAKGRENIPIRVYQQNGERLVVPWDAQPLIDAGTVDEALFDVTELSRKAYRAFHGTPVIVSYGDGSRSVAKALRSDDDIDVRARFNTLKADALTVPDQHTESLWETLTAPKGKDEMSLTAAPGIRAVSLDRIRQAPVDHSAAKTVGRKNPQQATVSDNARQVGADQAWQEGYDGAGTTIAVLDTGIDADHGDFEGKIRDTANFTDEGADDPVGHGTHVASLAAGSGARSGGTYRGIAPGADLLVGKVLGEYGGLDSWIIAGMEWAVGKGARIVSMSLGGAASSGYDPVVETLNELSEKNGTLFVVAAGNEGPGQESVGSPGVAASALTVGAVDGNDRVAEFSSVGPSSVDRTLKPDLSAPGVQVAAAAAAGSEMELLGTPVADGYVALDGTSMATPQVAGAAALLLQKHRDWSGEQLKSALVGSTTTIKATPAQTGTGRLYVPRALGQTVTADSNSLNFGAVGYPYGGADRIVRKVTYRNSGADDVTLGLDLAADAPDGSGAPKKLFSLSEQKLTVPAGGTAAVEVIADPSVVPSSGAGTYGVVVTATAGDQEVRTAGSMTFETRKTDITLQITDRDGKPASGARAYVLGESANGFNALSKDGTVSRQIEPGDYFIEVVNPDMGDGRGERIDWAMAPRLTIDGPTTLKVDLRDARKLDFTAPDPDAALEDMTTSYDSPGLSGWGWYFGAPQDGVHSLSVADPPAGDPFLLSLRSHHLGTGGQQYHGYREISGRFPTGLVNHPDTTDMAHVVATAGTRAEGAQGWIGAAPAGKGLDLGGMVRLPAEADLWLQQGTQWLLNSTQYDADGELVQTANQRPETYAPGTVHERLLNVGVFGPAYPAGAAFLREANLIEGNLSLFAPGTAASGWAATGKGNTKVYRNGELERDLNVAVDNLAFGVPEGRAEYRIVSTASRAGVSYTDVSTEVTVDYTFTSAAPAAGPAPITGPLAVRYTPALAPDNTAPAGRERFRVPVTVEGGTAAHLKIETSVDGGTNWTTVHDGSGDISDAEVDNPVAGGSVSLRATAVDTAGNRTVQTVLHAYLTR